MIRIVAHSEQNGQADVGLSSVTFRGGEVHPMVKTQAIAEELTVIAHLRNSEDVMNLLMTTDALRRAYPGIPVHLNMPYVPYARQDRVANDGEAHGIRVFCDLINAQKYATVVVQDPHSDVVGALLNNLTIDDSMGAVEEVLRRVAEKHDTLPVLVSPDAGARKRTLKLSHHFKLDAVFADKQRDTRTLEILRTEIHGALPDAPLLIVDDICDGGRTFIDLAKAIRAKEAEEQLTDAGKAQRPLYLYVTHGIFSYGLTVLTKYFEGIYTRNNWTDDTRAVVI